MRTAPLAAALLILSGCVSAWGATSEPPGPVPSFRDVPDARTSGRAEHDRRVDGDRPMPSVWPSTVVLPGRTARPDVPVPSPRLIVVPRSPEPAGHRARGTASWYCGHGSSCTRGYPDGLFAAAGPALRQGDWRGRSVVVMAGTRAVRVTLIDTCQCYGSRLLDLYSEVWDALGFPLSKGLLTVDVSW